MNTNMNLTHGSHRTQEDGLCLMEAVAMLGGEGHTDRPVCACPVLSAFGRRLNDEMGTGPAGDVLRVKYLAELAPRLVGTRSTLEVALRRALVFADGAVRVLAPLAMEAAGLCDAAGSLRALSPVIDRDTAAHAADAYAAHWPAAYAAGHAATAAYAAGHAATAAVAAIRAAARVAHPGYTSYWSANAAATAAARAANSAGAAGAWVEARALFIRAMEVSDE
jgi:hypothetical protein